MRKLLQDWLRGPVHDTVWITLGAIAVLIAVTAAGLALEWAWP